MLALWLLPYCDLVVPDDLNVLLLSLVNPEMRLCR
jgi:hypothetical protein